MCLRPWSFFSGITGLLGSGLSQIQAHVHRPRPALERLRSQRDIGVEGGKAEARRAQVPNPL